RPDAPIHVVPSPPTRITPPPPPPPAPPPPVEVENGAPIEDEFVGTFDPGALAPGLPPRPPAPPAPPPLPRDTAPPPPVDLIDDTDDIHEAVEIEPVLIGGIEGLQRRVTYPEAARRIGQEGTVYVGFVVERDGSITDVAVLRSPGALLSEAAVEAVRASRFEPGIQQGRAVRVRYTVPVRFVLR
ncbi:MAG TPA: energy transducer TonB, partial [Bacteroidetes bacterium]|nr:energy transducer TonB [Bacteroidota bacterium]